MQSSKNLDFDADLNGEISFICYADGICSLSESVLDLLLSQADYVVWPLILPWAVYPQATTYSQKEVPGHVTFLLRIWRGSGTPTSS